jgi:propanediol dehydratase small subunit
MSEKQYPAPHYPLIDHAADTLKGVNGRPLKEITLEAAAAGELTSEDIQISADTLHAQSQIAGQAGYPQLAANLTRAAELTALSSEALLTMYEMLRPRRSTYQELMELANRLENGLQAPENARLVRDAAMVYRDRGLLRQ